MIRRFSHWLCARFGHFEGLLEPRCDFCHAWLDPNSEPQLLDLRDLGYDVPELLPAPVARGDEWVPGAVYA